MGVGEGGARESVRGDRHTERERGCRNDANERWWEIRVRWDEMPERIWYAMQRKSSVTFSPSLHQSVYDTGVLNELSGRHFLSFIRYYPPCLPLIHTLYPASRPFVLGKTRQLKQVRQDQPRKSRVARFPESPADLSPQMTLTSGPFASEITLNQHLQIKSDTLTQSLRAQF